LLVDVEPLAALELSAKLSATESEARGSSDSFDKVLVCPGAVLAPVNHVVPLPVLELVAKPIAPKSVARGSSDSFDRVLMRPCARSAEEPLARVLDVESPGDSPALGVGISRSFAVGT